MQYEIRQMQIDDYDAVHALWQASEGVGLSDADSRAGIANYLQRNPGMSFVALAQGTIIGAVLCGHDGRRGYLHHLAVASSHRRQGIGKELVECCLAALQAIGIAKCNLFLFGRNQDGAAFWECTGWSRRDDLVLLQKVVAPRR